MAYKEVQPPPSQSVSAETPKATIGSTPTASAASCPVRECSGLWVRGLGIRRLKLHESTGK